MQVSTATVPLDESQSHVAEADADTRQLVIAGAGQGKTEVVAARLSHLIVEEGLSASLEMLVLSFSRAAVHAVKARLSERDSVEVNVRTFDSFAGQILLDTGEEPAGSFESRIRQATRVLTDADEPLDLVADLRHLVIDEVQDLVGDRAEFVLAILDHLDTEAGFTVLGDPLQGIYDFALKQSESKMSFDDFFARLESRPDVERRSLERNYRARGDDCRRVAALASEIRGLDAVSALSTVTAFEASLPHRGLVEEWDFLSLYPGRSAILCRSNAEVLRVSRTLTEQGIEHAVRRSAQSFGAARWISTALQGLSGPEVPRSEVEAVLAERLSGTMTADDAWRLVKTTEGSSRSPDQLNLGRLRSRVRSSTVPLSLTQGDTIDVVVSTIHRAKGLEFDNVFIVEPDWEPDDQDAASRLRSRYVALSRARDHVVLVKLKSKGSFITEYKWLPDRLQERRGPKGKSRALAIEFGGADVHMSRPEGAGAATAEELQAALADAKPGRGVRGELDIGRSDLSFPVYTLKLDGRPIGRTSDGFGEAFAKAFNVKPGWWPAEIEDLLLVSVESTAGDPQFTEDAGLGPGGFWLVPRIVGLARPVWDAMEEVL